jgi:hypothetical protein
MRDAYLRDYLVVYIERELAAMICSDDIIKAYDLASTRRAKFKITRCNFILFDKIDVISLYCF